jgi:hypothetical protein
MSIFGKVLSAFEIAGKMAEVLDEFLKRKMDYSSDNADVMAKVPCNGSDVELYMMKENNKHAIRLANNTFDKMLCTFAMTDPTTASAFERSDMMVMAVNPKSSVDVTESFGKFKDGGICSVTLVGNGDKGDGTNASEVGTINSVVAQRLKIGTTVTIIPSQLYVTLKDKSLEVRHKRDMDFSFKTELVTTSPRLCVNVEGENKKSFDCEQSISDILSDSEMVYTDFNYPSGFEINRIIDSAFFNFTSKDANHIFDHLANNQ